MSAIESDKPIAGRAPLFVIAGAHGSLHWAVQTFYLMLPFIKEEFGLDYTQTGFLVTIVHLSSFAANIPSGVVVDVTLPRPLDGASARCGQAKVARCLCQNDGLFLIDLELIQ